MNYLHKTFSELVYVVENIFTASWRLNFWASDSNPENYSLG